MEVKEGLVGGQRLIEITSDEVEAAIREFIVKRHPEFASGYWVRAHPRSPIFPATTFMASLDLKARKQATSSNG